MVIEEPTLNAMGTMATRLDRFASAFVAFAPKAPGVSLEIGAGFGNATVPALARGATVIANDLDPRHLAVLRERAARGDRSRLTLRPGRFPDELQVQSATVGAVLLARVLHFLDGPAIERGLQQVHDWLVPGGRVFASALTPYCGPLAAFVPIYELRRAAGVRWPGVIDGAPRFYARADHGMPPMLHVLDEAVLKRSLRQAGLRVERLETPEGDDDAGLVGFVASRPPLRRSQ